MSHLSRISEEIILWSSQQFNFVELPDRFCTGSSIMPQKKNPDVPELIRGKTGRVTGHLMSLFMLMKAQPLAYNKDNQEDKEPFFDSVETVHQCLILYTQLLNNLKVNREITYLAAQNGFTTATDLADYLVRQGIPFRDAHEIVGKTVSFCISANKKLSELTITELQQFSPCIQSDVYDYLTLEGSINSRDHLGGTALNQVSLRIKEIKAILAKK